MQKTLTSAFAALLVASSISLAIPQMAFSQATPTVSMVTLQTMPGENGQQMVVTPRGKVVPLPGAGVNSNVVQVYIGSQGGYWYVDKNGQNVDLTSAVQYMQRGMVSATQQVPQYAPQPVTVNNYEQSGSGSSNSSSGGSAAGTAVAAGLGAATGAALTNALMEPNYGYYHGVPYGMPMYYGNNGHPYYVDRGGNNVYVNNSNSANVNRNVNANANVTQNNINNQHVNAFQQQQNWYSQQATNKTSQFQNWQKSGSSDNPFVHPDAQNNWQNARQNAGDGNGRFGGKQADGGGGRFGRRNQDGGAGGGGLLGGAGRDGGGFGSGLRQGGGGRFAGRRR